MTPMHASDAVNGEGYDPQGYDAEGFDRDGYDASGFDRQGYDRQGYDRFGYNRQGVDRQGMTAQGISIRESAKSNRRREEPAPTALGALAFNAARRHPGHRLHSVPPMFQAHA